MTKSTMALALALRRMIDADSILILDRLAQHTVLAYTRMLSDALYPS